MQIVGGLRVAPLRERGAVGPGLGGEHELDRREVGLDRVDAREELGPRQQDPRGRVVEDLRDLRWRQPPVDRGEHRADLHRAEQELEELGHVLVEDGDPIAALDARGPQGARDLVRARVELAEGERPILVRDRRRVLVVDATLADQVGKRLGHTGSPLAAPLRNGPRRC